MYRTVALGKLYCMEWQGYTKVGRQTALFASFRSDRWGAQWHGSLRSLRFAWLTGTH